MTSKFGGGSVKGLEDFFGNKTDSQELTANLAECVDKRPVTHDTKLFRFAVKTRVGALSKAGPVNQLRGIADYLDKLPEDKRVMFRLEVWEDKAEGKLC